MTPINNYQAVLLAIIAKIRRGVVTGALLIETDAKIYAPVRTGNHRRSIHTEIVESATQIAARITHHSDYGMWLEVGTRHMTARPHFRPAYEKNKTQVLQLLAGGA